MPRAKGSISVGARCGVYVASKSGKLRSFKSSYAAGDPASRLLVEKTLAASGRVKEDGTCKKGPLGIKVGLADYAAHTKAVYKCLEKMPAGTYQKVVDDATFGEKAKVVAYAWHNPEPGRDLCSYTVLGAVDAVLLGGPSSSYEEAT